MPDAAPALSRLEHVLYNEGERMLPGITHSMDEMVRHRSSYEFFIAAIEADRRLQGEPQDREITIVDLGFGTGHGCKELARIPGARVLGIDNSPACRRYAERHYGAENITYHVADIPSFVHTMEPFDYVVSRGVIEHVPDGLAVARQAKWRKRLMIDVPYNEADEVNPHHVVSRVTEESFAAYPSPEIFYEETSGEIYAGQCRDRAPNMIMCACGVPGLPPLTGLLALPRPPWKPDIPYRALAPRPRLGHRLIDLLMPLSR